MKPTDLDRGRWPGRPSLHPDGHVAAVEVTRIDLDVDAYTSQIWQLPTDGGDARQITYGWRDSEPTYAPDGSHIAFLRSERSGDGKVGGGTVGKVQLWVMPTAGGEPRRLTDAPLGVEALEWSPDSRRLACLARVLPAGRDADTEPGKVAPRRITTLTYREDGIGFLDCHRQIWVVALNDGDDGHAITDGDIDHEVVRWRPDGEMLAFVAAGHDRRGDDLRSDVWTCRPDGSERTALTDGGFEVGTCEFSPDGGTVLFNAQPLGESGRAHGVVATHASLWSMPTTGGAPVRLTDQETHNVDLLGTTDAGALVANESRGSVEVLLVPYDGSAPVPMVIGNRQVEGADAAGGRIVATVADPDVWGEVMLREPDGSERPISGFNRAYDIPILPLIEVNAVASDGYPVHGWLLRPPGDGPHPVLLLIHGGPFAQYGWRLFDEAQVYAAAGYAVLMANPRGSSGYGQAHGRAILGNVGEVSSGDLMAILDHVLATDPALDRGRLGVLGGSHGGFMTTWIAAHEGHRFKAACSERAVNAIDSFTGSSDIGWYFADDLYGLDVVGQRRQSPLAYANDIDIPMLIIHSEQDWRCPVEQAQRLFVALRRRGATAEMLIFPGEGHEMSRSGLPSHRIARFDAILDWFGRYL